MFYLVISLTVVIAVGIQLVYPYRGKKIDLGGCFIINSRSRVSVYYTLI